MSQFVLFALLLASLAVVFAIAQLWRGARRLALALAVGLPLAAAGLYYLKGDPAALDPQVTVAPRSLDQAITQLEKRLASEPDNFEGLVLLARSYMALEKFELARDTYARAVKLHPDDNDLQVEYAESLLRTSPDRRFPPAAVAMLERAIAQNPQNQRALFFMGIQQMQDSKPAEAAATWERLLPLLSPDTAGALRQQIAEARTAAGLPALPEEAASAGASALNIDVKIDPSLAQAVRPGDVLYVFARGLQGRGPPLAVKRIVVDNLPVHVVLTDADSPMPAARLSSQDSVTLMARVSKSGNVTTGSGDIEADPQQVRTNSTNPVTLTLNQKVP